MSDAGRLRSRWQAAVMPPPQRAPITPVNEYFYSVPVGQEQECPAPEPQPDQEMSSQRFHPPLRNG
mgnify:CR=1 FL=1